MESDSLHQNPLQDFSICSYGKRPRARTLHALAMGHERNNARLGQTGACWGR